MTFGTIIAIVYSMIRQILLFLIALLPASIGVTQPPPVKPHLEVYRHVLKNYPKIDKAYADRLSQAIYRASTAHNLNPLKVSAILRQECHYRLKCINAVTKDYGIGQINVKTIAAFKFDKTKLLTDLDYSVEAAVLVLADFKRMFGHKEKDWFCRYNVGTAQKSKIEQKCQAYKVLVARYM